MIDLTSIAMGVVLIVFGVIGVFLIPQIRLALGEAKFAKLANLVKIAVEAAEQIYIGTGRGSEKKAYVLEFLNEKGYTVDFDTIEALIESEVYKLK